jgi:hypothetical protein
MLRARRQERRRTVALLLILLSCAVPLVTWCQPASACAEGNLDCRDRAVHTGPSGVQGNAIVVTDGHDGVRKVAGGASCAGCAWRVISECSFGTSDNPAAGRVCDDNRDRLVCELGTGRPGVSYRRFFSAAGSSGPWTYVGDLCLPPGDRPVSTDELFAQVRRYVDQLIPAAPEVAMQPDGHTWVRLPTLFQAGQPADRGNLPASKVFFARAGSPVALTVTVRPQQWAWNIDGRPAAVARDFCCRRYTGEHSPRADPSYYATYTFGNTGSHSVTATVSWSATMTVAGLGTVPVDGTFTRTSAPYTFPVEQARAQLEAPG